MELGVNVIPLEATSTPNVLTFYNQQSDAKFGACNDVKVFGKCVTFVKVTF
jgi:hypothetical protein